MTDIENLVNKAIEGDSDAYTKLYNMSRRQVYFTCLGLLKNEADAEDMMQETFFTVMTKLPELRSKNSFQAWVNRIAVNKCKDFLSKKADFSYEEAFELTDNEPEDEELTLPDEYVENEEKRKIIMNIIMNSLSDVQRQAIIMYYYDQMTSAEIAEEMVYPPGTVAYRLSSARKVIEKEVLKYEKISKESLHAVLPVPFLTMLLNAVEKSEATRFHLPDIDFSSALQTASNISSAVTSFTSATLPTAVTAAAGAVGIKTIAAIAAIVIGGGATAYYVSDKLDDTSEDKYVYHEMSDDAIFIRPDEEEDMSFTFSMEETEENSVSLSETAVTMPAESTDTTKSTTTQTGVKTTTGTTSKTSVTKSTSKTSVTKSTSKTTSKATTKKVTTQKVTTKAVSETVVQTEAEELWQTGYKNLINGSGISAYTLTDIYGSSTPELIAQSGNIYAIYTCSDNGVTAYIGEVNSSNGVIGLFSDTGQLGYTSLDEASGTCTYYGIDLSSGTIITDFLGESVISEGVVYERSAYFSSFGMTDAGDISY